MEHQEVDQYMHYRSPRKEKRERERTRMFILSNNGRKLPKTGGGSRHADSGSLKNLK